MHGRHPEAHGAVRAHHHGGDRAQAAVRDHAAGHQPVLLPLLHVQSGARAVCEREYLSVNTSLALYTHTVCHGIMSSLLDLKLFVSKKKLYFI